MKRYTVALSLFVVLLATPLRAEKRAFTIEDLYRIKSPYGIQVSPEGKSVVYAVDTSDLARATRVSHIWMMDIDGRNARQITNGEKGENSPRFSPDGKWISFISSRDGSQNLYLLPAAGGEAKKLTNISTGVSDPLWSPDSQSIAFSTDVYPECGANEKCASSAERVKTHVPIAMRAILPENILMI